MYSVYMRVLCVDVSLLVSHLPPASQEGRSDRIAECSTTLYGALTNPYASDDMLPHIELPPLELAPVSFDYAPRKGPSAAQKTVC